VNQNISIRGILGVEYVNFMEDGMPVYPTMHTFFMNADNLFRPDENIERVEVVRGGNSALFGSNAPGATVNFLNKTGGPEMGGVVKLTGGTGTLARYDFNVNGPLSEDWRFSLGGFYRYDQGIRDPGFPGIRGYQLKANTTRLLANGYVRLSAKILDDRNQFILPLPFQNPDDPKYVDGFSDTGSMLSLEGVGVTIPLPQENGELQIPLDDGIRTKGSWITADIGFNFANDWEIQNTARVMNTDHSWNALLPGDVLNANEWAQGQLQALINAGTVPAGSRARLLFTNHPDNTGNKQLFNTPNGLINPGGEWHVEKPISDFSDQLLLKKRIQDHNLNLGAYFAYYTQGNRWFFTDILTDIRDNPRFLDLVITNAAGTAVIHEVTQNGFRRFLSNYANGTGHATIFSVFGGDEFKVTDRLRLDIGGRYEHNTFRQVSENTTTIDLDGNPETVFNNEVWGNETFRQFDFSFDEWAASFGVNYSLNDRVALYAQSSRGFKTPSLDEFLFPAVEQAALIEARHTLMLEGGVKTSSSTLGLSVTGFYGELSDQFDQGAITDPVTGGTIWRQRQLPDNRSIGAEVEVSVAPASGLRLRGSGTVLDAEFTDDIKNLAGAITDTIKGNWLPVVPPLLLDLSGTYSRSGFVLSADFHFVGKRYSNNTNTIELPKYGYLNFGLGYNFRGQGISLAANLLNALQSKGFEEGNPRVDESRGQASNLFLARPLLPRRFTLEIRYDF
jgi:outer membrane receptor protein involved in Fe transport